MKVNGITGSGTVVIDTVFKVWLSRALLPAWIKCSLGKDNTFLVAFESAAVVAVLFVSGASCTRGQGSVAQDTLSELPDWLAVEPFHHTHLGYVVATVSVSVWFVSFLTAYTETSVPVYVKFIPRCVAKDFLVRHVWK